MANFRLAVTARVKDGEGWRDGETSFFRVNVWRQLAEHVAESLAKGDRAVVIGRLKSRSWETPEGDKRSVVEVEADEVAPSLRWGTAKPERVANGSTKGKGGVLLESPVASTANRVRPDPQARTSRAWGSAVKRPAGAVGPPGWVIPERRSCQGPGGRSIGKASGVVGATMRVTTTARWSLARVKATRWSGAGRGR